MGFETPADIWLRTREAARMKERLLDPGPLHEWLDRDTLASALDGYLAGERGIGLQVWRWLALESWARQYLARDPRVIAHPVPDAPPRLHLSYEDATRPLAYAGR